MKSPLTKKQQDIYMYIRQYLNEQSHSPTLNELRQYLNVGSLNTIVDHLKALEQKGYIVRHKHAKRNIQLRESGSPDAVTWTTSVPVIASVGCDDLSTFVNGGETDYYESINVDNALLEKKGKVVAVRAVGNSMNDADIEDGDYILVEVTDKAHDGDRIIAVVGDMITVKKMEKKNGLIILRPESRDPKYKPIILSENFKIAGKVICTIPAESRDLTEVVPIRELV